MTESNRALDCSRHHWFNGDRVHVFALTDLSLLRVWSKSVGNTFDFLSCVMQHCRFNPFQSCLVQGMFPM